MPAKYTPEQQLEKFWSRVEKSPDDDGCWIWTGGKNQGGPYGYGRMMWDGHLEQAHRIMWRLVHGPIPEGMIICHTCDRPECLNVRHLFLGTYQDNAQDRNRKGRNAPRTDENNGRHKLSNEQVDEIIHRYYQGDVTLHVLAEEYGISRPQVGGIVSGKYRVHCFPVQYRGKKILPHIPRGENSPRCKLTDKQVAEIRQRYQSGEVYLSALAREYGISPTFVGQLIRGDRRPSPDYLAEHLEAGRNGRRKLTDAQVAEIRHRYSDGNTSCAVLAREFGISRSYISALVNYKWRRRS